MLRKKHNRRRLVLPFWGLTLASLVALLAARDRPSAASPGLFIARDPETPRAEVPLRLDRIRRDGAGYVANLDRGRAELTLDPRIQRLAERVLTQHGAPYGAAVVLSVEDGRVLALAGHSRAEPTKTAADLTLTAWAPAASVFKVVTAAALVDRGVSAGTRVCFHDGIHSIEPSNLVPRPRLDRSCESLAWGLARSQNAILGRLAHEHLDGTALGRVGRALGFGEALPFEAPVAPSVMTLPDAGLEFARAAAGFWHTTLSPLHGAWLAATIGRGGVTPPLHVVDRVLVDGEVMVPPPPSSRRVLDESTARAVADMMVGTTDFGTARTGFHDRAGRPLLPGIAVAGKTGSLNRKQGPFLAYSWFVGFAPAARPEVAIAVLLGNGSGRHARAHRLAREILEGYFHGASKMMVASR